MKTLGTIIGIMLCASSMAFANTNIQDGDGSAVMQEGNGKSRVYVAHTRYAFFEITGESAEVLYNSLKSPEIVQTMEGYVGNKTKYGVGGQLVCENIKADNSYGCSIGVNPTTGEIYDTFKYAAPAVRNTKKK